MSTQKRYTVSWAIDIENEEEMSPIEAVDDCYNRIVGGMMNDWVWKVTDLQTGIRYEVDCEMQVVKQIIKQ